MTHEPARGFVSLNPEEQHEQLEASAAEDKGTVLDWERKEDSTDDSGGDWAAHYGAVPFRRGDIEEIELRSAMADMDHVFAHANRRQHRKNRNTVEQASHRNRRRGPANERFGSDVVEDHTFERNRKKRARRRDDYQ